MEYNQKWVSDIEQAIKNGSREKRVDSLRKVTNLFLSSAEHFNDNQIDVFDNVLCKLIDRIETRALAELSNKIAPVPNAPNEVIQRLARNDEITVAGPVLTQSKLLSTADLIEIANSKGQQHLLAISARPHLKIEVTDVLIHRGTPEVHGSLMKNKTAQISDTGFSELISKAGDDEGLLELIGRRLDIPAQRFRELLIRATEAVRARLLLLMRPEVQEDIERVLSRATDQVITEAVAKHDFDAALERVQALKSRGELNQQAIVNFVAGRKYEDVVAGISLMSGLPVELIDKLMHTERGEGLLIPCKVAGFAWPTVKGVLKNRPGWKTMSEAELQKIWHDYVQLSHDTAERINRFWLVREKVGASAA
jgi:uncharacterized protein (DUF2336 family)